MPASVTMISPATQPSSAAPAHTRIGNRSSSRIRIALPAMMSGTLVARPKTISTVFIVSACAKSMRAAADSAAAAIAITLSRLITMSATVTSQTARNNVSPALTLPSA